MSPATQAWDTPPPRRYPGRLVVLAVVLILPAAATTVLRVVPPRDDATALLASFIPYGIIGYLLALLVLLVALLRAARRWFLATLSVGVASLTVLHLSWLGPFFLPDDRPASRATFSVLTLNLYNGAADPEQVRDQADRVDLVVLVETTPKILRALAAPPWRERFPYAVGGPEAEQSNTTIYSRFPLSGGIVVGPTSFQQWITTVQAPGVGNVRLVAVHPCSPYCGGDRWAGEHAALRRAIRPYLADRLVVAGDFNAIDDHGPLQDLRADGLRSAADLAGAGWMPTYPANRAYPPLFPIDHVLVNQRLTATEIRTVRVAGTDHLGLVATLAGTA